MAFAGVLTLQIGWMEVGLALSVLLSYVYYTWMSTYTYWKRRNVPYLEPAFPFGNFSDVILFRKNFSDSWLSVYNEIGNRPFCGVYSVKTPILVIKDPKLIKQIMAKDFNHFTDHGWFTNPKHEPLINNLFHMQGDVWKNMRATLAPAFSSGKMKMMFPTMHGCARQLKISLQNVCKNTGTLESKDLMSRFTMDVIINCVFGLSSSCVNNPDCDFYRTGNQIFKKSFKRMFACVMLLQSSRIYSLLRLHFLDYEACQYFANLMINVIEEREKNRLTRNDFIDILVRLKNNMSIEDEDMFSHPQTNTECHPKNGVKEKGKTANTVTLDDLLAQALTFFFAGFETVASALSFCLYELSIRPDLQLKIQAEVDAASEEHGGFTYKMMQNLPYTDNVINETLRRYSALSAHDRVCVKSYRIPGTDITIEKGCKVTIPHYAVHHDQRYYPEPFEFDPDRFLEENVESRPAYTFMPFGDGPRLCIGMRFARMEMRLALATFFSEFSCKLNPATPVPLTIVCGEIMTTTKDKILIDVLRRS